MAQNKEAYGTLLQHGNNTWRRFHLIRNNTWVHSVPFVVWVTLNNRGFEANHRRFAITTLLTAMLEASSLDR